VSEAGIDVDPFLADINEKIERRGFVLYDGQILTRPLDSKEPIDPVFEPCRSLSLLGWTRFASSAPPSTSWW